MTAPLFAMIAPATSPGLPMAGPTDSGDGTAFGAMLDVAFAAVAAGAGTPAVAPAAPPPADSLIELLVDGEWVAEDGEGAAQSDEALVTDPQESEESALAQPSEPPVEGISLERGLEIWMARIASRADRPEGSQTAGIRSKGYERLPVAPAIPEDDADDSASSLTDATVESETADADPAVAQWANLVIESGLVTQFGVGNREPRPGLDDPILRKLPTETTAATTEVDESISATDLLDRRQTRQPIVEIAGFDFPVGRTTPRPERLGDAALSPTADPKPPFKPEVAAAKEPIPQVDWTRAGGPEPLRSEPTPNLTAKLPADAVVTVRWRAAESEQGTLGQGPAAQGNNRESSSGQSNPGQGEGSRADTGSSQREAKLKAPVGPDARKFTRLLVDEGARPGWPSPTAAPTAPAIDTGPAAPIEAPTPVATEAKPAVRHGEVVLQLGDDQGDIGRLKVAVHGPNVRATIIPNDPAMADRLTGDLRELRVNLEERGFPEPRITVQAPRTSSPTVGRDLVMETVETKSSSHSETNQDPRDRGQDSARPDQRHRSPDRSRQQRHHQEEERRQ